MLCPECGIDHHAAVEVDPAAAAELAGVQAETDVARIEANAETDAERIEADVTIAQINADAATAQVEAQAEAAVDIAEAQADAEVEAAEVIAEALTADPEPIEEEPEVEPGTEATDEAPESVAVPPQVKEEAGMGKPPRKAGRQVSAFRARRQRR